MSVLVIPIAAPGMDSLVAEWLAKLPASREAGVAEGFDSKAWLAGYLEASAIQRADEVYLALGGFMAEGERSEKDLWGLVVDHGTTMLLAWGATMTRYGCDTQPWAAEAADKAAVAYRQRVEELLATAGVGGRA